MTAHPPLVCSFCGQPAEDRDIHFRFKLPDALFEMPEAERQQKMRDSGDAVGAPGAGVFVRVLLPVKLTDSYQNTYGTWLRLSSKDDFDRARTSGTGRTTRRWSWTACWATASNLGDRPS